MKGIHIHPLLLASRSGQRGQACFHRLSSQYILRRKSSVKTLLITFSKPTQISILSSHTKRRVFSHTSNVLKRVFLSWRHRVSERSHLADDVRGFFFFFDAFFNDRITISRDGDLRSWLAPCQLSPRFYRGLTMFSKHSLMRAVKLAWCKSTKSLQRTSVISAMRRWKGKKEMRFSELKAVGWYSLHVEYRPRSHLISRVREVPSSYTEYSVALGTRNVVHSGTRKPFIGYILTVCLLNQNLGLAFIFILNPYTSHSIRYYLSTMPSASDNNLGISQK